MSLYDTVSCCATCSDIEKLSNCEQGYHRLDIRLHHEVSQRAIAQRVAHHKVTQLIKLHHSTTKVTNHHFTDIVWHGKPCVSVLVSKAITGPRLFGNTLNIFTTWNKRVNIVGRRGVRTGRRVVPHRTEETCSELEKEALEIGALLKLYGFSLVLPAFFSLSFV